jgi:HEAT repeat protein
VKTGVPTLTELLKQHHVDLTEAGLLGALQNPDAQVRFLAAARLAEVKAMDAIPAITEALTAEKVPETRINIAFALAQLGEETGVVELTSACVKPDLPDNLRLRAAGYLLDLKKSGCLATTLSMLKPDADPGSRIQALSLVQRYDHLSADDFRKSLDLIVKALTDQTTAVRIYASLALGTFGDASAIPPLQNAIANEQDDGVRSQMQESLELLQNRQH